MIITKFRLFLSGAQTLRQRATLASAWTIAGFGIQRVVQLGSNLILTHLLFPAAFGLMALANVILIGIHMFSDVGIKPAIVQSDDSDRLDFLNTAWTIQIIRGFMVWFICCLLAWPASIIYRQPVLFGLICVLGSTAAIGGFASTGLALREKRLHLGMLTTVQVLSQVIALSMTALLVWLIGSVWALAYGAVVSIIITTALGFIVVPSHRHRLRIDPASAAKLFRFGRWIFATTLVTYLGGNGLRAIQGGLIPIQTLGVLAVAQTFAWMPGDIASQVQDLVGFPALAEARRQGRERFSNTFIKIRTRVLSGAIAMFYVVALGAGPFIWTLYDGRYHEAASYIALLSATGPLTILGTGYGAAFIALGNLRIQAALQAFTMVSRIVGTVAGFELGGVVGMLLGVGIGNAIAYAAVAYQASKEGLFSLRTDGIALLSVGALAFIVKYLYF
ncbi:oligosaccharide flippase family protein [Novosphingobium sp.]|uniref:oligosaccharide flippase family protein n=1 Tax=Novosphingobium sp. TaxID=1874826 RepID=UPI003B52EA3D